MKKTNMDQDVLRRLKTALNLAAKRLSAEASKGNPASHIAGTPENFAKRNPNDKSVKKIDLNDGKHFPAVLEEGERVLNPKETHTYDTQHPEARKKPMTAEVYGLPKVRGFDLGGIMSAVGNEAKHIGSDIKSGYNKMTGGGNKGQGAPSDEGEDKTYDSMDSMEDAENNAENNAENKAPTKAPAKAPAKTNWNDVANSIPDAPAAGNYIGHPAPELGWAFDKGGMVSRESVRTPGNRTERPVNWEGEEAHTQEELQKSANEGMQHAGLPKVKLFDDGGTVETEDAPGQRALDNDQLIPEPDRGRIIPSHSNAVVSADTDRDHSQVERMSGGAKMNNQNYYEGDYGMDTSNPPKTQMVPASAKTPLGRVGGMNPSAQTGPAPAQHDLDQDRIEHEQKQSLVRDDISQSQQKGDLLGTGRGLINENVLNRPQGFNAGNEGLPKINLDRPESFNAGTPASTLASVPTSPLPVVGGGAYDSNQDMIPDKQRDKLDKKMGQQQAHADYQQSLKVMDTRIAEAQQLGTAEGDERANRLLLAKQSMQKNWGTAENHPGFLGKLGHIGARIGEGALDSYLGPDATATFVPGSPEAKARDAAGYRANVEADSKENLENAQAKAAGRDKGDKESYEYQKDDQGNLWRLSKNSTEPAQMVTFDQQGQAQLTAPPAGVTPPTAGARPTFGSEKGPNASARPEQVAEYASQLPAITRHLKPEDREAFTFPKGYTPTIQEIKDMKAMASKAEADEMAGRRDDRADATARAAANKLSMEDKLIEQTARSIASMDIKDLSQLKSLASLRGDQRMQVYARAKELNPNFNTSEVDRKVKMQDNYTSNDRTGSEGNQLQSFDTFLGHAGDANQVVQNIRNSVTPKILNIPLNALERGGYGTTAAQLDAALEPVKKEFEGFLLGGRALYGDDRKQVEIILNPASTPAQIQAALKQMTKTVEIRYNELDHKYQNTMKVPISEGVGPMSTESINAARSLDNHTIGAQHHMRSSKGDIYSDDGKVWYDTNGKQVK